jgi:hypothetical protein
MCFTSCMLIRRPAYHINERVHSCTRGTRSAGPDGPNGTQTKELATVSQNGVVYLAWSGAAGLVTSLSPFPRSRVPRIRRGVDRSAYAVASLAICIFDFMTPYSAQSRTLSESGLW